MWAGIEYRCYLLGSGSLRAWCATSLVPSVFFCWDRRDGTVQQSKQLPGLGCIYQVMYKVQYTQLGLYSDQWDRNRRRLNRERCIAARAVCRSMSGASTRVSWDGACILNPAHHDGSRSRRALAMLAILPKNGPRRGSKQIRSRNALTYSSVLSRHRYVSSNMLAAQIRL